MNLKLNYKRTFLIGFAFFGILLLWQVYDSWCPTFLTDIFARRMYGISSAELKAGEPEKILNVQWLVGIIMACDNLAALILLPIFGNLSDFYLCGLQHLLCHLSHSSRDSVMESFVLF